LSSPQNWASLASAFPSRDITGRGHSHTFLWQMVFVLYSVINN
jgi:hypothetical protein